MPRVPVNPALLFGIGGGGSGGGEGLRKPGVLVPGRGPQGGAVMRRIRRMDGRKSVRRRHVRRGVHLRVGGPRRRRHRRAHVAGPRRRHARVRVTVGRVIEKRAVADHVRRVGVRPDGRRRSLARGRHRVRTGQEALDAERVARAVAARHARAQRGRRSDHGSRVRPDDGRQSGRTVGPLGRVGGRRRQRVARLLDHPGVAERRNGIDDGGANLRRRGRASVGSVAQQALLRHRAVPGRAASRTRHPLRIDEAVDLQVRREGGGVGRALLD